MTTFITKHSTVILLSGLLMLLILAWVFPTSGLRLGITFLLLSFLVATLVLLEKHKKAYRSGKITRSIFIRNVTLEISGTFLIMLLAGILGRYVAEVATHHIVNDLTRMVTGIGVGLVVGLGLGFLAKKTLSRLVDIPIKG